MNEDASLRADCAHCAGLCCVALAFDRSALFAEDKPAGQACRHLLADRRSIHATRARTGYAGCVAYDCLGAGQLVTQDLFGGRSWRDCGDGGKAMFIAFAQARQVQQWRQMLLTAAHLPLTAGLERRRRELAAQLTPAGGWTVGTLAYAVGEDMRAEMADFLRRLREFAASP